MVLIKNKIFREQKQEFDCQLTLSWLEQQKIYSSRQKDTVTKHNMKTVKWNTAYKNESGKALILVSYKF